MLYIYPSPLTINILKKINSNANINVGTFHNDIIEYNDKKHDIEC